MIGALLIFFIWLIARITKRVVRKMASAEVFCVVISKFFTQLQTREIRSWMGSALRQTGIALGTLVQPSTRDSRN